MSRLLLLLLAFSLVSAVVGRVAFPDFGRTEIKIVGFVALAYVTSLFIIRGGDREKLIRLVIWTTVINTVFTALFTVLGGTALLNARYFLISGGSIYLIGFMMPLIGARVRSKLSNTMIFMALLALMILSQTRGFLLAVIVAGILHCVILMQIKQYRRVIAIVSIAVAALITVASFQNSEIVSRWVSRAEAGRGYSLDPTTLTRLAEYRGQMRQIEASTAKLMLGAGVGARFTWDHSVTTEIVVTHVISKDDGEDVFDFGHSLYVYSVFSMGLLGGWILPVIFVGGAVRSFRFAISRQAIPREIRQVYHQLALGLVTLLILGLTSHTIGAWQGNMVAAVFSAMAYLNPQTYMALQQRRVDRVAQSARRSVRAVALS